MAKAGMESTYEAWMRQEGPPTVRGYGVTDVGAVKLGPWPRLGGRGAFLELLGMEGLTGMYVGEIPPGGALNPEKHLYDELLYILSGRGATKVWSEPEAEPEGTANFFEWQAGSLFAPPLNARHQLLNGSGSEPARFLGVTTAPLMLDVLHNPDFIFGCDFRFADRYDGRSDYFQVAEQRRPRPDGNGLMWETNFIPDVRGTVVDPQGNKGPDVGTTQYEMAGNVLAGHIAEWPTGRYHKAHYHGGGAILLILRSRGYTLMWPREAGLQPYRSGHGDQVVKVDWQEGSVFSPPTGWFHQHFNTGPEPARQLALRYGSQKYAVRFHDIRSGEGTLLSVKLGGAMIEYEDEDPDIRRQYQQVLADAGLKYDMVGLTA